MTLPTYAEVLAGADRSFAIWGPNSGGGQTTVLREGRLYEVVYGDETREPGGEELVRAAYSPHEYAALFGAHPMHAAVIAYLRERGLL